MVEFKDRFRVLVCFEFGDFDDVACLSAAVRPWVRSIVAPSSSQVRNLEGVSFSLSRLFRLIPVGRSFSSGALFKFVRRAGYSLGYRSFQRHMSLLVIGGVVSSFKGSVSSGGRTTFFEVAGGDVDG